jgi:glycosyltransferase involved in cell wall biosynthesis
MPRPTGLTHRITVCVPTLPGRASMLRRALMSVEAQTYPAYKVEVATDEFGDGAAITRNRALFAARTKWVAFLDDDDVLYPEHLETLVRCQLETGADVVWPWFDVSGGGDPFPMHYGRQWDPTQPHSFPITALVRRIVAVKAGGFPVIDPVSLTCAGEDFAFWCRLSEMGARFAHVRARTWRWNHWAGNTGGLPSRR